VAENSTPYWDRAPGKSLREHVCALWRAHSDAVNGALLASWWPVDDARLVLKTDLFDEAVAPGLYPSLASRASKVIGIDVSALVVRMARARYHALPAVVTDVRGLPFQGGAFDLVVSNSTLDHFGATHEIVASLLELRRVLRPGGHLLLTLDNRTNPFVALRNVVPFRLLSALGLVPYPVGVTCGARRLGRMLQEAGFDVLRVGTLLHCPRVLAVAAARLLERRAGSQLQARYLRLLMSFERLAHWPTRSLTGHFVAALAVKR
jgi:SAM-dependent methyltransferase